MERKQLGEKSISVLAAMVYAGKNWHTLNATERELVGQLEEQGYLIRKPKQDGFVGQPVHVTVPA